MLPAVSEDSIARVISDWHRERPDLDVEPIAVAARLARVQARLGPRIDAVFERFGLRSADFAVLATLVRLGGRKISQKRLIGELDLSAGTISLRVDRLVSRGLVRREPDPADGRGAHVLLTERGRSLFEACAPEHLANTRDLLCGLTPAEHEQLGMLLGKLLSTLEDPAPNDDLARELGILADASPFAVQRRRAVGLPPQTGLLIRHVDPTGPAAAAGIRPGDLLTAAGGKALRTRDDLRVALAHGDGRELAVEIMRGVEPQAVVLDLREPAPA